METRVRLAAMVNNTMRDVRKPRRFIGVLGELKYLMVMPACGIAATQIAIGLRPSKAEYPVYAVSRCGATWGNHVAMVGVLDYSHLTAPMLHERIGFEKWGYIR